MWGKTPVFINVLVMFVNEILKCKTEITKQPFAFKLVDMLTQLQMKLRA